MKHPPTHSWRRAKFLLSVVTALSAAPVKAAPLAYDEASDGDINSNFFTLEIGTNTITGHTFAKGEVDFDIFDFELLAGTQVNSITYEFSNVTPDAGSTSDGFGLGMDTASGYIGDWEIDVQNDISPVLILDEILPLTSGSYTFDYYLWYSNSSGDWDYTLTFEGKRQMNDRLARRRLL